MVVGGMLMALMLIVALNISISFTRTTPMRIPMIRGPRRSGGLIFSRVCVGSIPRTIVSELTLRNTVVGRTFVTCNVSKDHVCGVGILADSTRRRALFLNRSNGVLR